MGPQTGLPPIDWNQPWLAPYRATAALVLRHADWRDGLNAQASAAGLTNHAGLPLRFVSQAELPNGVPYEAFISASGRVPTRPNLHDFFNGLVWLTFPGSKAGLNRLQAAQIAALGVGHTRGAARDAATIFDENAGLLLTCHAGLEPDLRAHRWQRVFIEQPELWRDTRVWLFGHALLEKLTTPYKGITAHARVVRADAAVLALPEAERLAWLDREMAQQLASLPLRTEDFTPLPVLGVPGWCSGQDRQFYADGKVFRSKRG